MEPNANNTRPKAGVWFSVMCFVAVCSGLAGVVYWAIIYNELAPLKNAARAVQEGYSLSASGLYGDSFGAVSSIVAVLTLVLVAISFVVQGYQTSIQLEEIERMKKAREEDEKARVAKEVEEKRIHKEALQKQEMDSQKNNELTRNRFEQEKALVAE